MSDSDSGADGTDPLTVIAIGGEPATGKSTLVKQVLRFAGPATLFDWGLLKGQLHDETGLAVLGQYKGEDFDGTDTLSMAVIDDAEDFVRSAADPGDDDGPDTIIFEGDRLFNDRFLSFCDDHPKVRLHAFVLTVPEDVLEARHHHRGDDQSESWLSGRSTKYERYAKLEWTDTLDNSTPEDLDANAETIAAVAGLVPVEP